MIQSKDGMHYYACGWTSSFSMGYNTPINTPMSGYPTGSYLCSTYMDIPDDNVRDLCWNKHFYVLKIDRQGNVVWEMTYGFETTDAYIYESRAYDLVENEDGNIIVVGYCEKDAGSGTKDKEHYMVLIDESDGTSLNQVCGSSLGIIANVQWHRSIVQYDSDGDRFAVLQNCENPSVYQMDVMVRLIDKNLITIVNPVITHSEVSAGAFRFYATDMAKDPNSDELAIGTVCKDCYTTGEGNVLLHRVVIDEALGTVTVLSGPPNPVSNHAGSFDFQVGVAYTSIGEIAMISSTREHISSHVVEPSLPSNPQNGCNSNTAIGNDRTDFWGADALLLITDNNRTTIGLDKHYEHINDGNFGNDYPNNVSRMECLYSIVEGHDGSLITCGNDGANFDDYIVIKFSKPCYEAFLVNDIDATDPEGVWNLFSNATITGTKKVQGKIIVNSGITLTIQDATLSFSGTIPSGIIVKQGGRLIIERSKLTNLCELPWEGIWVYGTPVIPQSIMSIDHGYMQVRDNSTIENAYNAIYLGDPNTSIHNGGIIRAENSFFYNNRFSINFPAFGGAAGKNISRIEKCKFDCFMALFNNPPSPDFKGTLHHVALVETHGVKVLGCEFSNTGSDELYDDNFRSNGIQCINATVFVDRAGPVPLSLPLDMCDYNIGQKNEFYNLHKGINILDITFPVPNAPINRENILMSSNFNNCRNSIVAECDGSKKVYRNYFQYNGLLSADFNGNPIYSMQMEVADDEGYVYIDSNSIRYVADYNWAPHSIGITLTNTALHSGNCYIYRNVHRNLAPLSTYTGPDRKFGFFSEQENPRVLLKCNEYYNLNLDWHIKGTTTFMDQYDPLNPNVYFNDFSGAVTGNAWSVFSPTIGFTAYGRDDDPLLSQKDPLSTFGLTFTTPINSVAPSCPATSECAVKYQFETEPGEAYEALGPGMMMPQEEREAIESMQKEINELVESLRQQNIPLCQMDAFTQSRFIELSEGTGRGAKSAQAVLYHCGWDMQTEGNQNPGQENDVKKEIKTDNFEMALYPNPTNSDCQILLKGAGATNARITIVNVLGQEVLNIGISPGQTNVYLPTGSWKDGVYFASYLNEEGKRKSIKFVVKH